MRPEIFFALSPNPLLFLDWKDDNGRVSTRTSEAVEQSRSGRYTSSRGSDGPLGVPVSPRLPGGKDRSQLEEAGAGVLEAKHGTPAFLLLRLQIVASQ